MKSGSSGSKKPKLKEVAAPVAGSFTTIASWPKRSKKIVPGCIVATPMRGVEAAGDASAAPQASSHRSEEHTSELQSLMRISYAVFCLKKKKTKITHRQHK